VFNFLIGKALLKWLSSMAPESDDEKQADRILTSPPAPDPPPPDPVHPLVQRRSMGSLFEIYLSGTDREALIAAGEEALNEVERQERQLSHYRDDSDVSRLNMHARQQWVRLEPKLYDLLKRCCRLSHETGGAFDITSGPLVKAWGFFRGEGNIPSDEQAETALAAVGSDKILFDDEDHLVYFAAPNLEINLGAVGKGVAVDEAARTLRFFGVENAVIHGGHSTIYAMGDAPPGDTNTDGHEGWPFEIKDPRDRETVLETVRLHDEAISTSGNYEQFFEVGGVRYTHILDPRTGRPVQGMISVSVISPSAEESDALSTAFFVLGRKATQETCKARPNIRVIMVEDAGSGEISVSRFGFDNP
jgi:thiamine biosynthesis lipoprotein